MENSTYSYMNVLVTGGAGFIGSHLVEKLVTLGAQVTVLDDLSTGSLENLQNVSSQIKFIHGTINNLQTCIAASKQTDIIFHLAAFISVPESMSNPINCFETNVNGTLHLLKAAHLNKSKRVVFSSSSAVYGSVEGTCSEHTNCKPESPYGHSKLMGELLCRDAVKSSELSAISLRYFNVYGERQNPHGQYAAVVAQFKERMKLNQPITIYGDGSQTRDFVPVCTVVQANLTSGLLPLATSSFEVFNVGTGQSITLLQLVEQLKNEFPEFSAGIRFSPARKGDIKQSNADCTKFVRVQKMITL
ncbi:SDR family NAD(P)-dependent oxidoreductase [Candidatus Dependentiae bacterium]|nr:SDR family NAD(P)-dependent oxidoreductase [Candidatus Dependentiae bacterium]